MAKNILKNILIPNSVLDAVEKRLIDSLVTELGGDNYMTEKLYELTSKETLSNINLNLDLSSLDFGSLPNLPWDHPDIQKTIENILILLGKQTTSTNKGIMNDYLENIFKIEVGKDTNLSPEHIKEILMYFADIQQFDSSAITILEGLSEDQQRII